MKSSLVKKSPKSEKAVIPQFSLAPPKTTQDVSTIANAKSLSDPEKIDCKLEQRIREYRARRNAQNPNYLNVFNESAHRQKEEREKY